MPKNNVDKKHSRWDSPNNKKLIDSAPIIYRSISAKQQPARGTTCIVAPVGKRAAFFGTEGRKFADFTDGLEHTIVVVEAAPERAVTWTKPDDLTVDEDDPAAGLFGSREGGVLAGFGDGTVQFIPQAAGKDVLKALFTINGGETIPAGFGVHEK